MNSEHNFNDKITVSLELKSVKLMAYNVFQSEVQSLVATEVEATTKEYRSRVVKLQQAGLETEVLDHLDVIINQMEIKVSNFKHYF